MSEKAMTIIMNVTVGSRTRGVCSLQGRQQNVFSCPPFSHLFETSQGTWRSVFLFGLWLLSNSLQHIFGLLP